MLYILPENKLTLLHNVHGKFAIVMLYRQDYADFSLQVIQRNSKMQNVLITKSNIESRILKQQNFMKSYYALVEQFIL